MIYLIISAKWHYVWNLYILSTPVTYKNVFTILTLSRLRRFVKYSTKRVFLLVLSKLCNRLCFSAIAVLYIWKCFFVGLQTCPYVLKSHFAIFVVYPYRIAAYTASQYILQSCCKYTANILQYWSIFAAWWLIMLQIAVYAAGMLLSILQTCCFDIAHSG